MNVVNTKCFFLCQKCLKIVEAMRNCEISGVKTIYIKSLTLSTPKAVDLGISRFHETLKQLAYICEEIGGHGKLRKSMTP